MESEFGAYMDYIEMWQMHMQKAWRYWVALSTMFYPTEMRKFMLRMLREKSMFQALVGSVIL